MNPKYIFVDIDGTLYDSELKIPESSSRAIRQARENGHKVFICTGRPREEVEDFIKEVGFDGYIYSSGALIEVDDEILFYSHIEKNLVKKMEKVLQDLDIGYSLEGRFRSYLSDDARDFFEKLYIAEHEVNSEMIRHYMHSFNMHGLDEMQDCDYDQVVKLSLFSKTREALHTLKPLLPDMFHFTVHQNFEYDYLNAEISDKNVSKATGMDIILKHFQGNLEDSIAIGDSMNDASMVVHANIGVCMGNGPDELKQLSDYVADSIKADGLYKTFKHFSLI